MSGALIKNESEIPVSLEPSQKAESRLRKKSLMFGLVTVAIIIIVLVYALFQSPMLGVGAKATELKLDYNVGEKMTYEMEMGMQMFNTTISETIMLEMEVQDFDAEYYTVKYTVLTGTEEHSFTLKMNETGYLTENNEFPDDLNDTFSYLPIVLGFGSYLTGEEVRVGYRWEIPLDVPEIGFDGKISFVITELGKMDVPAGTYDVFKVSIESSSFSIKAEGVQVDLEMDGVLTLEKDTCRLVDFDVRLSLESVLEDRTGSIDMNFKMTLIKHLK